jgi:hypothetical protein
MSEALTKENYNEINKASKETDISLDIKENNNELDENKLKLQEDRIKETEISDTSLPLEIDNYTNLENINRYGLNFPFLFIRGEPFILISPNCKIIK